LVRAHPSKQSQSISAHVDDVLGTADAVELARRIRHGEIHPTEAVEAAISRAERVNPLLNAIAAATFDAARADALMQRTGGFAGVPSFIKDTDPVAGAPMRYGSRGMPCTPAEETSPCAQQFLSTGVISLGKTTTPEFGLTGTTEPLVQGPTCNPWDPTFSSGGSSGGSAALVAAGVVPIAHANDGGGSIRIPAACCGLVGLKPSRGRLVNIAEIELFPVKIVHQGMLSRTVRDTAAYYQAAERYFRNPKLPEIGRVEGPGRRLRIGFFTDLGESEPSHPECVDAATSAALLCERLGHSVELVPCPFDDQFHEDFFLFWASLAFAITRFGTRLLHPEFDRTKVEEFTNGLSGHFRENASKIPGAVLRLRRFARRHARMFDRYDVLMNPTLAMPPPELGFIGPEVPFETALERLKWFIPFTPVQNVCGNPAISLPLGRSESGLPIGIQFASAMGAERTLLELALELEDAAPFRTIPAG
jgi:amidase